MGKADNLHTAGCSVKDHFKRDITVGCVKTGGQLVQQPHQTAIGIAPSKVIPRLFAAKASCRTELPLSLRQGELRQ